MKIKVDQAAFAGQPVFQTLRCWCGQQWRGHHKFKKQDDGSLMIIIDTACPNCGEENMRLAGSSSDPETERF